MDTIQTEIETETDREKKMWSHTLGLQMAFRKIQMIQYPVENVPCGIFPREGGMWIGERDYEK